MTTILQIPTVSNEFVQEIAPFEGGKVLSPNGVLKMREKAWINSNTRSMESRLQVDDNRIIRQENQRKQTPDEIQKPVHSLPERL